MIPEVGQFALIVAFLLAAVNGVLPVVGAARGIDGWMRVAWPVARAQFVLVAIAFGCLAASFINNDFSVVYVASNSNSMLPLIYRFTAVWGGHEGSLLLWILLLTLWMAAVSIFSRQLPMAMVARVLGVMSWIAAGFLLFLLFTSNPFLRLLPPAMDGRDLNALLQDPGMVSHPPILYMGYVGFAVAFAFAIAALLSGELNAAWARWSRPWTTAAWIFLTLGIMLGSGWAYYELGWGGWWFWDPVENASFMPWLAGTALIHSLAVTEKRGCFRSWTVLLAICTFSLSLLGTFLVRSGVITSVHSFASDPARGIFILVFLSIVTGGALLLFAWRAPKVGLGAGFEAVSRETLLLSNNVLLMVAAASVLIGTLYPLCLDVLGLGKISVGAPYFDTVFVPLMTPAVFLMGVGPIARWKAARLPELAVRLRWAAAASVVTALGLPWLVGGFRPLVGLGVLLAAWSMSASAVALWERIEKQQGPFMARFARLPRAFYGMLVAHAGIGVFIIGVTFVKGYETERDVRLEAGQSVTEGGYTFRFDGTHELDGPNYHAARARIAVSRGERPIATMYPEKRFFIVQQTPMTEAAIDRGVFRDLYVALGEQVGERGSAGPSRDAWTMRIHIKPFVSWIWAGCLLMALGGALAASDRRYRLASRTRHAAKAARGVAHDADRLAPGIVVRETTVAQQAGEVDR
ncbi:heme lyase CcmF/NrfE family subunit [Paraburkholderia gardini]|uniref:Cytochrome c-type biogenesis protein CcmF n=1 Tax=Paraburkholderia gardini TaxID=2823469 RepID=A0ABM8U4P8_9BURK|nr:heme lyase CcmF/NrfE family subunit [Paraburkholderia gardini]CAG4902437.1 Cytochrome c-type biogenesis protein CcmF [Paraburkholderia gardini]